jgi:hypothetical protein
LSGEDLSVEKGNLERLIALRNEISSTRTQTGASGKANKQKVDDLDSVISSMMKILELEQQIQLEPLKELRSIIDSLPNVFRKANTAMKGLDDNPLSKWNAIDLSDMEEEVVRTLERIKNGWLVDGVSVFGGMNESNVDTHLSNSKDSVKIARANAENALKKKESGDVLTADDENKIAILKAETEQLNDIIAYKEQINEKDKAALDLALAKLDTINQIGGALSALGNTTGMKGFGDLGGVVDSFGTLTNSIKDGKHDFDFGKMFDFKNIETDAFAENFGKGMQAAVDGLNMGSMVGQFVGGFTGGGASAQAGGALGGMIGTMGGGEALAGALGMGTSALATGGASLAISAGMSLIGGLFEDDGEDQKEAERKTKEANKTYEKNTDALNKLAQNMASLSGGVDGLNSTLISSFSKIPTFGKLTDVTDTMKDMYATMEKTRAFNEVAYQVTKTKKGSSGFMGIGATADTSWTETIEVSVQEMLNKYGFKGTIEDMTTDQLRDFSTWLDDYDMGDSDNFSILADAIEDYAEALDKFDKNIDKFFYDTTMESFNGISSLDQEELRQQIEDFYKDLGYQIDDEMSKVIDELAQNMSVMVTIMQDVRGEFVSNWRESGGDAGSAFVSSMSPYIDAMLGNISQIFYDVYYSDVTESLEDSFKKISEELVELKKQGADLDWSNVTGSLATEFDKVLSAMISAKQEATSFNDVIMALQQQAIEAGLTLSEIFELGLTTGTQGDVLEMFKSAVLSDSDDGALTAIGDFMGDKIGEALSNKLMDNLFSTQILEFSNQLDSVLSGELKFSQLAGLMSQANAIGIGMEQQRLNLEAIMAGFNFDQDITYETDASKVEYSAGTSQQNTYVYNISSSVNAGNVIESDSINSLAEELLDVIIEKLKVDKGIDITKNY